MGLRDIKKSTAVLQSKERRCAPKNFFRTSLYSAGSSCQTSHRESKNDSERTSFCAPKVIQEVIFPKYFWAFVYRRDCSCSCALRPRAHCGFSLWRQMAQFEEGQGRQLLIDLDAVSCICQRARCSLQCTKGFIVKSVGGATSIANQRWKFSKTQKKKAAESCQTLRMITIETVVNSTRVMGAHVSMFCRYCIAFEVMLLFSQFCLFVCHAPRPERSS